MKRTPLHEAHVAAGAKMVDFAGWHMPVQYGGVLQEHRAVRNRAGLFDVSHMGEIAVEGPEARAFVQYVTCNDLRKLRTGRAQYNALTTHAGTFVDDLLVYARDENRLLLVVNAANIEKDFAWLQEHGARFDVRVENESAAWAQLSIQGPRAESVLQSLVEERLASLRYYSFLETTVAGAPCLLSRTGYTGEDGFELYAPAERARGLWDALLEAGSSAGLVPVGLGARDTLRLEAKMALYGNDIDETTTVLEADLGWIVKLNKGEFIGRDVLEKQAAAGIARKLIGFEMQGRAVGRHGYSVLHDGGAVGRVTSGSFAPSLGKNIGLAYVPVQLTEVGSEVGIEIRNRVEPARVVPTPFYRRPRRG